MMINECQCGKQIRSRTRIHDLCFDCRRSKQIIDEDYRETKAFDDFCACVLAEIVKLGNNAKYSTLSGEHAPFYLRRQWFNDAIAQLEVKCLIEKDETTLTTYFRAVEPKEAEKRKKKTAQEFIDDMGRWFFGEREREKIRPLPSSFPERAR